MHYVSWCGLVNLKKSDLCNWLCTITGCDYYFKFRDFCNFSWFSRSVNDKSKCRAKNISHNCCTLLPGFIESLQVASQCHPRFWIVLVITRNQLKTYYFSHVSHIFYPTIFFSFLIYFRNKALEHKNFTACRYASRKMYYPRRTDIKIIKLHEINQSFNSESNLECPTGRKKFSVSAIREKKEWRIQRARCIIIAESRGGKKSRDYSL